MSGRNDQLQAKDPTTFTNPNYQQLMWNALSAMAPNTMMACLGMTYEEPANNVQDDTYVTAETNAFTAVNDQQAAFYDTRGMLTNNGTGDFNPGGNGLHPSARGDYKIAQKMIGALSLPIRRRQAV